MKNTTIASNDALIAIVCCHNLNTTCQVAAALHKKLGYPVFETCSTGFDLCLVHTGNRLELQQCNFKKSGSVFVDFSSKILKYRLRHGGGLKQLLVRAAGVKQGHRPSILDATAGLGRDGFILASLGCQVTMIERNPVIAVLLEDGLRRGLTDPDIKTIINENITFMEGDSSTYITTLNQEHAPDTIYLDPMYPIRSKSAMVKKEMQVLQKIAGKDTDAPNLLTKSLKIARDRVVIKRPKLAASLRGPKPSFSLKAQNSRYDIYLTLRKANSENNG